MMGRGFTYGQGLFETLKLVAGRATFVEEHLARMEKSADFLGLSFPRAALLELLNKTYEGTALKLILTPEGIFTEVSQRTYDQVEAIRLGLFGERRHSSNEQLQHKTLNYLQNLRALAWAKDQGLEEALFQNEHGYITEGAKSNLFVLCQGSWYTSPVSEGLLPGIMRGRMLDLLGKHQIPYQVAPITPAILNTATAAFVTNALMGLMPVKSIGQRTLSLAPFQEGLFKEWRKEL